MDSTWPRHDTGEVPKTASDVDLVLPNPEADSSEFAVEGDGTETGPWGAGPDSGGDGPTRIEGPPRALVDPDVPRLAPDPGFAERYVAERLLGQGGMGTVRVHHDRQIGRHVAMKVMRRDGTGPGEESRFVREARIQGQLEHPSVVPVYDLALDPDGQPFFTMRRVKGLTLEEITERLAMGAPKAFREEHSRRRLLSAFSRVCLAVHYAHEHGVLHRDLKPSNIILGEFGEVYVLDWGLAGLARTKEAEEERRSRPLKAMRLTRETLPGSLLGTPGYISPEQAMGQVSSLTPASDIYSLGAILFEVLTWSPMHDGENAISRIDSTIRGTFSRRASVRAPEFHIPPELDGFIEKATAQDPRQRYASARALHLDLETFLDGQRDEEQRIKQADERARSAAEAAEVALTTSAGIAERRSALRDAMGAMALDPGNARAMDTFVRLITDLPDELPKEVDTRLAGAASDRLRWVGGVGSITYASMFTYLPLFGLSGVTSWTPLVVTYSLLLVAAICGSIVSRSAKPSPRVMLLAMVVSNLGLAATTPLLGPLLLTPSLIAINTAPYALYLDRVGRRISLWVAGLLVVITTVLGLSGIIPGGYGFEEGTLVVHSGALQLSRVPTLLLLFLLAVGQVATAALSAAWIRRDLDRAERTMHMQSWLLRGLTEEARRETPHPSTSGRGSAGMARMEQRVREVG